MTAFNEKKYLIGTAEYGANFWNAMKRYSARIR